MDNPRRAASPSPIAADQRFGRPDGGWRAKAYAVIFESDTPAGRWFDLVLIGAIVVSVVIVVLDSVKSISGRHGALFHAAEWFFTMLFTLEYLARLVCVKRPLAYARSAFGIIDLLSVLPTWLALLVPGVEALIDVRILRLLRIFRILKMGVYVAEYSALGAALRASRRKIFVFLSFVLAIVLVMGTVMYVVEGEANGFTSIPVACYWAVTTMTTVGFGDITPKTDLGRFIASTMMLLGWGILAVPTGIVSAEFTAQRVRRDSPRPRICAACGSDDHLEAARYCAGCGAKLPAR